MHATDDCCNSTPNVLFLFRVRFGLYAVLSRLDTPCDWAALEQGFAEQARDRRLETTPR